MKTRILIIVFLLLILGVLLSRNSQQLSNALLHFINPVKQEYKHIVQTIEEKGQSYLFQQEAIERLNKENQILRKVLLEQKHYIKQVEDIYTVLPKLSRLPYRNVALTQTISYVKLNTFSRILLSKPEGIENNHIYGLIQKSVVAGIARLNHEQLYGYLTSDPLCRFAVFVGKSKAPGIAVGKEHNTMVVKFIPKWYEIKEGEKVITSGLDKIFFYGFPVGVVTKVETQSAYKIAYIKTYADLYHPDTFFLIKDANATLTEGFESNSTKIAAPCPKEKPKAIVYTSNENNTTIAKGDNNKTQPVISSIPSRIDQTQEETFEPTVPAETPPPPRKRKVVHKRTKPKPKKRVKRPKPTPTHTLDLF